MIASTHYQLLTLFFPGKGGISRLQDGELWEMTPESAYATKKTGLLDR